MAQTATEWVHGPRQQHICCCFGAPRAPQGSSNLSEYILAQPQHTHIYIYTSSFTHLTITTSIGWKKRQSKHDAYDDKRYITLSFLNSQVLFSYEMLTDLTFSTRWFIKANAANFSVYVVMFFVLFRLRFKWNLYRLHNTPRCPAAVYVPPTAQRRPTNYADFVTKSTRFIRFVAIRFVAQYQRRIQSAVRRSEAVPATCTDQESSCLNTDPTSACRIPPQSRGGFAPCWWNQ